MEETDWQVLIDISTGHCGCPKEWVWVLERVLRRGDERQYGIVDLVVCRDMWGQRELKQDGQAGVRPWRALQSRLTSQGFTIKLERALLKVLSKEWHNQYSVLQHLPRWGWGRKILLICVADNENIISYPSKDDEFETLVSLLDQIFMASRWSFLRTRTYVSYFVVLPFV